jgi:anti-sigma B factor antagonist
VPDSDRRDPPEPPSKPRRSGPLTVEVESGEDRYVVRAEGELDISNVELFEEYLRAAEASSATHVLVDLNALSFMDSAGLRVLLLASRRAREDSKRLSVRATGGVRRIIELTGMASYLALGERT